MALPVTDTWSQSSGSTQGIATYGAYSVLEGSMSILSGTAGVTIGGGTYNTSRRTDETFNAAQYSQVVVTSAQISAGLYCGPAVRCQSGANTSYHVETSGSNYYLSKCVAGTQSTLAGPVTLSFAAGDVLRLEIEEVTGTTTLRVYKALAASPTSFTLNNTYTDTSSPITTAGTSGVFGYGNSSTTPVIGTWTAGNLSSGVSITAGLGALTLTGLVPTVSATGGGNVSVSSGLGQAVITGLAPTVAATGNQFANAGLGQAVITGLAPTVVATDNIRITSALGQAVITGFAPSQTLTLGAPGVGQLVLSGHAPTVQVSAPGAITTGLGALVFTGLAPSVNAADSASITAGVGSLVATGLAPTVSATANVSIASALGQAVITGLAPTLAATANQFAAPDVGQAVITGYAPALSQAGSFSAAPGVGILELLGLSPSVVNSGDATTSRRHAGYIWPRRRNYIYKGKRYRNLTPDELMRLIAADEADITREDIKVSYKNKKPHIIAKDAWADLQTALQSLSKLEPIEYDDDEDIEAIIALL